MTDEQFLTWLKSPSAIRCVLVEARAKVDVADTTFYMSNMNYVTSSTDTPTNTAYRAVVNGNLTITETLGLDGTASLTFGDIEINNTGDLDHWLLYVWTNRDLKVFVGDPRWPRADFRQVFSGVTSGLSSRSRTTLNLSLRDKLQRLNTPATETKLGGTTQNKDSIIPLVFGEVHNIEPLLIDPALLKYQVHNGPIERIIEVRDNGVPVSITEDLAHGTFELLASPAGTITCSVQGDKPSVYYNTVSKLIQRIVTGFGKDVDRFATGDLDLTNLNAFDAAHQQAVGIYINDRVNVLSICEELASSIGAQVVMSRGGLLRLLAVDLGAVNTDNFSRLMLLLASDITSPSVSSVTSNEMVQGSLHLVDRPDVQAAVKLGFCKNWTVQNNIETGIPQAHKDLFAKDWLTYTASDASVKDTYRLTTEPEQVDTMLLTEVAATAEANRRLTLWKQQRQVVGYTGTPALMLESLGGYQTITHSRFGLQNGVTGQITKLTQDWVGGRVQIEVLM